MNRNHVIKNYFGSKNVNGVYQFIINRIPPHKNYIEGFLGGGSILLFKKPACITVGIDCNSGIIDTFNYRHHGAGYNFFCGSFIDVFEKLKNSLVLKDTFIYLDPPYLHNTRSSSYRYKHELSDNDHIVLLNYVRSLCCSIAISTYDSSLYQKLLNDWNKENYKSITRSGVRSESLYMNYDISQLHSTMFTGKDFTDRQRIKRKVERHVKRLRLLPQNERQAIIDAIIQEFENEGYSSINS